MQAQEHKQFEILCDTAVLLIESYREHRVLLRWYNDLLHPRHAQVDEIKERILAIKSNVIPEHTYQEKYDELLICLNDLRYFFTTKTVSQRLRERVQDALLAVLNFQENDVARYHDLVTQKHDIKNYIKRFQNDPELLAYKDYYTRQHAIFGISKRHLKKHDIIVAAKAGLINGKVVSHFGVHAVLHRTMSRIKKELHTLIQSKIECGYLTSVSMEGYIEKINRLFESFNDKEVDIRALIQNARYLLENIITTAGVLPYGAAKYPEHAMLITACYWVDDVLMQAKAKIELGTYKM